MKRYRGGHEKGKGKRNSDGSAKHNEVRCISWKNLLAKGIQYHFPSAECASGRKCERQMQVKSEAERNVNRKQIFFQE